jgi:hypothetical protein
MDSDNIWKIISGLDSTVMVGLTRPGRARGIERGRKVLSNPEVSKAANEVRTLTSATDVVWYDSTRILAMRVRLRSAQAIDALRRSPFVSYVEPSGVPLQLASGGCSSSSGAGNPQYTAGLIRTFSGDSVSITFADRTGMNIPNAWRLSSGAGERIGITDTGLDVSSGSEFSAPLFAAGMSSHRQLDVNSIYFWMPYWDYQPWVTCSHGTRIAGIVAAPANGRGVMGVAYKSSVTAVKIGDTVIPDDASGLLAIRLAGERGARVIEMAWGLPSWSTPLSDEIDYWYYERDVMFVGAAGTCASWLSCPTMGGAVMPARKEQVLAVTSVQGDGTRPPDAYDYGSKAGVSAFTHLATTGLGTGAAMIQIGGTSGASAVVAGIAGLVRARHRTWTNRQVMEALMNTSGPKCGAPSDWKWAMVNASAAVGGPCVFYIGGYSTVYSFGTTHGIDPFFPFTIDVRKTLPNGQSLGGSGSYTAAWLPRISQVHATGSEGLLSDGQGTHMWRSNRLIQFRRSHDGHPYRDTVTVRITDNVFGTVDERVFSVLVCPSPSLCYDTQRPFPTPPGFGVSIQGPATIITTGTYEWHATVTGATLPYSTTWEISHDGGVHWQWIGSGYALSQSFSEPLNPSTFALRATVTQSDGATIHAVLDVHLAQSCGGVICE